MNRQAIFALAAVVLLAAIASAGDYSGGDGSAENPYQIATPNDMNEIGADKFDWFRHFILMADINMSGYDGQDGRPSYSIIGYRVWSPYEFFPFSGSFDGQGHTISNLTISSNATCVGLFGIVSTWAGRTGEIKNLGLVNPQIEGVGAELVGTLLGELENGIVENCRVVGGSVSNGGTVATGGIAGFNFGTIQRCRSSANVSGTGNVGGLVGLNWASGTISGCGSSGGILSGTNDCGGFVGSNSGVIIECSSTGWVSLYGEAQYVGGFVGKNHGFIYRSYSTCGVSGNNEVGGFVGRHMDDLIVDCYATNYATGNETVGGFAGLLWGGDLHNCYSTCYVNAFDAIEGGLVAYRLDGDVEYSFWDTTNSTLSHSDGGVGKTTVEMKQESLYINAGWDFMGESTNGPNEVWVMRDNEDYPKLVWTGYYGGKGTSSEPYEIWTSAQMQEIGNRKPEWDKYFLLMSNIDMGYYDGQEGQPSFNMIGYLIWSPYQFEPFRGTFDGQGYLISNLCIQDMKDHVGLFGYLGDWYGGQGHLKNLILVEPQISSTALKVGALIGHMDDGTVENCRVEGGSVTGSNFVGGITGAQSRGLIENCHTSTDVEADTIAGGLIGNSYGDAEIRHCSSSGDISGNRSIGGLIGENYGEVSYCFATCNIEGAQSQVGGLVGENTGDIAKSYTTGDVTGGEEAGGIVGRNVGGTVSNCYATGSISGTAQIGGLVGLNWTTSEAAMIIDSYSTGYADATIGTEGGLVGDDIDGVIADSFWNRDTGSYDNGLGTSLTAEQMQTQSTFTDAGWDFVGETANGPNDIWDICEGTNYPKLAWQVPLPGDFVCPDGVGMEDLAVLCEQWLLEELSADDWPDGGDGVVDFLDWAVFADDWQNTMDINELAVFVEQWLQTGVNYYIADTAPDGGDGVVNMLDFAVFADNWLEGI